MELQPIWLTPEQAATRAQVGRRTIYTEVRAGRLRAARIGGRRELRIKPEWIDLWLEQAAEPHEEPTRQFPRDHAKVAAIVATTGHG
jgi:excisionase family DNA binding protein